ncbi:hypothetical protein F4677DRAFT_242158 [Hypoxylon crocopeplum]|nr:hypothetical protein F4677DRAFT_242158 [Hypoxylon crocopeplum]
MRRARNKKSRFGCKECKQRHIKCDESRPSCVNCTTRDRPCSFVSSLPIPRIATPAASPDSVTSGQLSHSHVAEPTTFPTPTTTLSGDSPASFTSEITSSHLDRSHHGPSYLFHLNESPTPNGQVFTLRHLELLNHFKTDMSKDLTMGDAQAERFADIVVQQATRTPYLMDQVLAVAASHMCTRRPAEEQLYRDEATHLQTRALALLNAVDVNVSGDNCLPMFFFSIMIAQQVLFDTFSTRTDFPAFLDKLVACFNICGGIRTIAGQSWQTIGTQLEGVGMGEKHIPCPNVSSTTEFSHLEGLIRDANLSSSSCDACIEAIRSLQSLAATPEELATASFTRANLVLRWPVLVSSSFVKLVDQRRPEALIIIAYYAVLIHDARDYWAFGDAGQYIIRTITSLLGSYWAKWLAWPNEVLDRQISQ